MRAGWLYKRTRKHANWTNWTRRWCVLSANGLNYFNAETNGRRMGTVAICRSSVVEALGDTWSLTGRRRYRLKVSNQPYLEIEMSASTDPDKAEWLTALRECVESAQSDNTPVGLLLKQLEEERSKSEVDRESSGPAVARQRLQTMHGDIRRMTTKKTHTDDAQSKETRGDTEEECPYDNVTFSVETDKLKTMFIKIDKNGNGLIDEDEFAAFVSELGVNMPRAELDLVYETIGPDHPNGVSFDKFMQYFVSFVMGEDSSAQHEARLRAAFLKADRDGSGAVSFKEFATYLMSKRPHITVNDLLDDFEKMGASETGMIEYRQFRQFMTRQASILSNPGDELEVGDKSEKPEACLRGYYSQVNADDLKTLLQKRWKAFASFKRFGNQNLVMKGKKDIVEDLMPGQYTLLDLACFNDLPPITPKHAVIKNVSWISSGVPGVSGRIVFLDSGDTTVPVDIATNEHLAYYDCSLATGNQMQVSLLYRHGLQDFTYENNYLQDYVTHEQGAGGAGLETHEFAHLDCPLDEDAGVFVIGKLVTVDGGNELHLTAFKVPTLHTIYVAPDVIHSNDYLKGTWRTMLSDEANIDHVQLVYRRRNGKVESYEHFQFSFC